MNKNYFDERKARKKPAKDAMFILLLLVLLLIFMLARMAYRSSSAPSKQEFFGTLPTDADAYEMAKQFVRPMVPNPDIKFAEDRFQFGKPSDSVYVVRSYFQGTNVNDTAKTYFKIALRYKGGATLNKMSWAVMSLEK